MSDEQTLIVKTQVLIYWISGFVATMALGWKYYLSDRINEIKSMLSRIKVLEEKVSTQESSESSCKKLQDQRHEQHEIKLVAMQESINHSTKEVTQAINSVGRRVDQILLKMVDK